MPDKSESPVEIARRHVSEAEIRIARQQRLIETLERDKHPRMVPHAQKVLDVLKESLELARVHLELEIKHYGDTPAASSSKQGDG